MSEALLYWRATFSRAGAWALMLIALTTRAAAEPLDFQKDIRPVLDQYCGKCHGERRPKGEVNLAPYRDVASIYRDPKTWENVLAQLRDEAMPPDDKPQPPAVERERLMAWLHATLENPDPALIPRDPGPAVMHRLTPLEYNNTVRDLLGVTSRPADVFPPDGGGGGGFDNNSATLFVPPILVERYLAAAEQILKEAAPERIFTARPESGRSTREAAESIIANFLPRAFRRPADAEEKEALLQLFKRAEKRGDSFEDAVRHTLKAALVSPNFLFRIEQNRPGAEPARLDDYELANRLSYFLWASMPDEELFRIAGEQRLQEPAVLEAQVRRMLADPKARAFAEDFAGQWLRVRELTTSAQPDPRRFSEFTPELRDAMLAEPIEFFHALLREGGSLLQLLDADHTFLNETLAKHYGIDGVTGSGMQRVALTDRSRGGVLGMGAVLTLTSYPLRTSPVLRGKWVLDEILGTPPPPPPAMVKSLPQDDRVREGLTLRQRLEKHRSSPDCISCHKRMDPLGFGLENFDAIGRWRTEIAREPVDASGEMITGEKFNGPAELKALLLNRKDEFTRTVTEKMFAYALGRGVEYYDRPILQNAAREVARNDYSVTTLIMEVVRSYPFQHRRSTPAVAQTP